MSQAPRRLQVQYGQDVLDALSPEKYKPQTTPDMGVVQPNHRLVDTFVRPQQFGDPNAGAKLAQLAQGLSQFAPALAQFAGHLQDRQNDKAASQAETDVARAAQDHENLKLSLKQLQDKGVISASSNPFYVSAARQAFGGAVGNKFAEDLQVALKSDPSLSESVNVGDFDKTYEAFRSTWSSENLPDHARDQFFDAGFERRANAAREQARMQFSHEAGARIENQSQAAVFGDARKLTLDMADRDPAEISGHLQSIYDDAVSRGISPVQAGHSVQKAVLEAAQDAGNVGLLKLLDTVKTVGGLSLHDMDAEKSSQAARDAMTNIVHTNIDKTNAAHTEKQRSEQERTDAAYGQVMTRLLGDRSANVRDIVESVKDIPGAADLILKARETVNGVYHYDDDAVVQRTFAEVWNGTATRESVLRRFTSGGLTLQTANSMLGEISRRDALSRQMHNDDERLNMERRRDYRDIVSDPLFSQWSGILRDQFKPIVPLYDAQAGDVASHAQAELSRAWAELQATPEGARMSPSEKITWLQKQTTDLAKTYRVGDMFFKKDGESAAAPKAGAPEITVDDLASLRSGKVPARLDTLFSSKGLTTRAAKIDYIKQQAALLQHAPTP